MKEEDIVQWQLVGFNDLGGENLIACIPPQKDLKEILKRSLTNSWRASWIFTDGEFFRVLIQSSICEQGRTAQGKFLKKLWGIKQEQYKVPVKPLGNSKGCHV